MQDLIVAVFALAGGWFSAWLSDRCITAEERGVSLFAQVNCAGCGRKREAWDRVPLLSWLLNGGKCRFCGAILPKREPLITFCTIGIWMLGLRLWMPLGRAYALINAVFGSTLLCAAGLCWIDASERPILFPLLLCAGVFGILIPDRIGFGSHLIGAAGLTALGFLMRILPESIRGREKLRWDTLLYMGFTGLILGWKNSFSIFPAAVIIGALLMLLQRKKDTSPNGKRAKELAYADPVRGRVTVSLLMTGASALALVFGRPLMDWYLRIFEQIG